MNNEMIKSLIDKVIKVDRGGPESRLGLLLAAECDYITLLHPEEGIIYYNTKHIKSLTYNSKNQVKLDIVCPEDIDYIQERNFKCILKKLALQWVKINRGGPETLEGVMDSVTDDFVTIVANEEIIRVALFHIRNISYGITTSNKKSDKDGNSKKKHSKSEKKHNHKSEKNAVGKVDENEGQEEVASVEKQAVHDESNKHEKRGKHEKQEKQEKSEKEEKHGKQEKQEKQGKPEKSEKQDKHVKHEKKLEKDPHTTEEDN